jgi:hypothetical protein
MTDRELMQMALDALESWQKTCLDCGRGSEELGRATKPIKALRERLAQPEREWVGLTDYDKLYLNDVLNLQGRFPIIEAIEAKLKEKNT